MSGLRRGPTVGGRVADFDVEVGLGHVETVDGRRLLFHCVEIADGSRDIEVGAEVEAELLLKFGEYEAASVRPAGSGS